MKDHTAAQHGIVAEDIADALFGLAGVNDDRAADLAGKFELKTEDLFLPIARREIVVKIQPGLADGHQARMRIAMHGGECVEIAVRTLAGFVWVNSGRHEHVLMRFEDAGGVGGVGGRGGDGDHTIDALLGGSFDQSVSLRGQLRKCQVAVRVDQHRGILVSVGLNAQQAATRRSAPAP